MDSACRLEGTAVNKTNNPKNRQESRMKTTLKLTGIAAAAAMFCAPAYANSFRLGDVNVLIENRISAGVAVRTQDPASDLVGIANGGTMFSTNSDDANKSFDSAGDVVSAPLKLLTDLNASWGNFTFFARGGFGMDAVYLDRSNFRESDYGPGREAPLSELDEKNDAVRGEVGRYAEVLDLYLSANHRVANRNMSWRVGRQVINWGESTFIQNGLNAILAANANRAGVPGAELEEVFIPAGKVFVSFDLIDNVTLEGFYQFEWRKTVPFASGTFFSTNDFVGIGGTRANIGFGRVPENAPPGTPCSAPPFDGVQCVPFGSSIPREPDREASNSGQYGGALKTFLPIMGGVDLGFYAANYHSRLPLISGLSRTDGSANTQTSGFIIEYPEDIQMYGTSFSTSGPFGTSIQGEYSYKVDQPLQLDDVEILLAGLGAPNQIVNNVPFPISLGNQYIRGWRRHDVSQWNGSFTKLFGPNVLPGSSALVLLAEAAVTRVHGLPDPSELRYEAPGTPLPGNQATADSQGIPRETGQFATTSSWGYRVLLGATYNNVFNMFTMRPSVRFDHDVNGITPSPIGNFVEGRKQVQAAVSFDYLSTWQFDFGYTVFTGGGSQNLLRDRDFAQMAVRYAF
jgi:hypothetical protein